MHKLQTNEMLSSKLPFLQQGDRNSRQDPLNTTERYYENKPIQIYWKFYDKKGKFSNKRTGIFYIPAQNIDCGYTLEPPWRGDTNKYP